jgi:hypothetical protein
MQREKQSKRTEKSVPPSFETDTEQVRSVFSNDSFHSIGEHTMPKKFDFNSLVTAEKQQSVDDHAVYHVVLREIARDECTRPQSEILRLLERCERDTSDLKADVEWRVERDEKIAEIKREEEYRTKNAERLAKLKAMREAFEKVEAEYDAARNPIIWESDVLDDKLRNVERYRAQLFESCRDTNLKLELEVLESSFNESNRLDIELYDRQRSIRNKISQLEFDRENLPITQDRQERKKDIKQEIKRLQEEWQQIEIKKGEIAQKKVEHQKAVAALREKMIFS